MSAFPLRSPLRLLVLVLLATFSVGAFAAMPDPAAARSSSRALKRAAHKERVTDHRLVVKARKLKRCQARQAGACAAQRRSVQRAGLRHKRAQRRLNRVARNQSRRARASATVKAPTLAVNGQTLSWSRVGDASRYVLLTRVPEQADLYSVVTGTSVTPPAVPGTTVRYKVRVDVRGSTWSKEVAIAYPAVDPTPAPTPDPEPVDLLAAPDISVSGTTISWNKVGTVTTYVFVKKVPGELDKYSVVSGTSVTPTSVPGKTVRYSVRTAVDGSAWAPEVAISYPDDAASAPAPDPAPAPAPAPIDGSFQMGLVAGSAHLYELPYIKQLGGRTARLEFGIGTSAASMASAIDGYAKAGIRPLLLAGFPSRLPTSAEVQNLASWAAAYGPGGTFWQGKSYPAGTAVTTIELGNETSYSYQFSDNSLGTYAARAQTYAQRAKEAAIAVRAANANVGVLAIGDNAVNGTHWVVNLFKAVPDLDDYVSGWTIHPYGPNWATRVDSTVNSTKTAGSRDLPIWITEWGLSTDGGRCLDDNYGFDKCMDYDEAADTLHTTLAGMQARYGSRLGAFFLFQAHDQYATGVSTSRERYFGALQSNGGLKGAFTAEVKADLAAN
jgi:hypothetical protein